MSKWANCSLFWRNRSFALSLTKNEWFTQKIWLKLYFSVCFFVSFFKKKKRFAHSLFLKSNMSALLRSLTKNERMSGSLVFLSENRWANSQSCYEAAWANMHGWEQQKLSPLIILLTNKDLFFWFNRLNDKQT